MAGADIPGAAGGVGRVAIWKFPGLREHLCNWFRGEVWTMDSPRGQEQTEPFSGRAGPLRQQASYLIHSPRPLSAPEDPYCQSQKSRQWD